MLKEISVFKLKGLKPIDTQKQKDYLWETFIIRPLITMTINNEELQDKSFTLSNNEKEKDKWFDEVLEAQKNNKNQKGWSR